MINMINNVRIVILKIYRIKKYQSYNTHAQTHTHIHIYIYICLYIVLATAKLTSFSFLPKNEDAYCRERRRIFQRTKKQKNEDAKRKRKKKDKNTKTPKKNKTQKKPRRRRTYLHWALFTKPQIISS